jgi:hypothetical protein
MKNRFKKWISGFSAAAMLMGCLAGGMTVNAEESADSSTAVSTEAIAADSSGMVRSYLTGKLVPESIGRTRPIAVMLNNIYDALPQSGIGNAEIVYEAPVEGGITRLMGIFEDYQDVERIGSVRSSREYYVYFAREFDAFYLHFGQAWYALELLWRDDTLNLSGLADAGSGEGDIMYYRGEDFPSPHNVFTNYDLIQQGIDFKGYSRDYSDSYTAQNGHYQFAADDEPVLLENGQDAAVVSTGYDYNNAYFVYDEQTGKYTRYQFGDTQIDMNTGNALTYDNILLQYCSWTTQVDSDTYLDINVLTGGSGKYITRGKAIDVTWSKDGATTADPFAEGNFSPTRYYDANGEEITLNQGKTWVCIVLDSNSDNVICYPDLASFTGSN